MPDLKHGEVELEDVRLHFVEAGAGPLVILLHGFPEFWYSWHHQLRALAEAGYRAVAPDMRGYNRSDRPAGVEAYRLRRLVDDVAGLMAALGSDRAAIAGHDWGGVVAWRLAIDRPALVDRLIVLNAPHPAAMRRELRTPGQLLRSWYVFFFQLPAIPEWVLSAFDFAVLERVFRTGPRRPFTDEEIRRYKDALSRPGALTAMINYYRAAGRRLLRRSRGGRGAPGRGGADGERPGEGVRTPTLLIWGERDRYLGRGLTRGLERWVPDLRIERLPRASHWVQQDAPQRVSELMIEFLAMPNREERPWV